MAPGCFVHRDFGGYLRGFGWAPSGIRGWALPGFQVAPPAFWAPLLQARLIEFTSISLPFLRGPCDGLYGQDEVFTEATRVVVIIKM